MATKKAKSSKGNVKVGQLKVKTTKVKAKELKKVKGGAAISGGYDHSKNIKV
jgi:hypothetical protein